MRHFTMTKALSILGIIVLHDLGRCIQKSAMSITFCTLLVGWLLTMASLLAAASAPPGEGRTSWAMESRSRGVSSIRKLPREDPSTPHGCIPLHSNGSRPTPWSCLDLQQKRTGMYGSPVGYLDMS